jgi:xylulose-5-phosphate/fructose-6-phosphate phosphoketolase
MAVLNEITEVSTLPQQALSFVELQKMDAYWRACNYLCAGMIYLRENPLLGEPLRPEQSKNVLLGHWGSDPGQHKWGAARFPHWPHAAKPALE